MVFNFFSFLFVSLIIICGIFCIMWELYVERMEGANVKTRYEFKHDPIKKCFECKIKMKAHYQIKNIKILWLTNWFHLQALNNCNNNSIMKYGHLFKIYWNIEQMPYPHASEQSCHSMLLEIDQAQQPFCFSLGTFVMNLHFIMNDA